MTISFKVYRVRTCDTLNSFPGDNEGKERERAWEQGLRRFPYEEQQDALKTRCFREAYTGLPVVRVTENQKALNCVVLNYSIPVSEE